jgi:hypothetical protein
METSSLDPNDFLAALKNEGGEERFQIRNLHDTPTIINTRIMVATRSIKETETKVGNVPDPSAAKI